MSKLGDPHRLIATLAFALAMACADKAPPGSHAGGASGNSAAGNATQSPTAGSAGVTTSNGGEGWAGGAGFAHAGTSAEPALGGTTGAAGARAGGAGQGGYSGVAGSSSIAGGAGQGGYSGVAGSSSMPGGVDHGGYSGVAGTSSWAGAAGLDHEPSRLLEFGAVRNTATHRPNFGGLVVANDEARSYVVEARRDIESGPLGLAWRTRFRLAAYERGTFLWAFVVDPDDLIGDVVVHPSGEITLAWEKYAADRLAYRLVRLGRDGTPRAVDELAAPATIPEGDHAATETLPLLRMKSAMADATTAGWLRLAADGENVVVAILSYVDSQSNGSWSNKLALAIEALDWHSNGYVERWARLVDGTHGAEPAAWAYDELRWREQAIRPFFTHDSTTREWLVGRAWNSSRCSANRQVFAEFTAADCVLGAASTAENERLPLAVTRFSTGGERLGTLVIAPEPDAAEQVPFALVANDGRLYVAGALVRSNDDGSKHTYPNASGYVDYDGYVSVHLLDGTRLATKDVNLGRGDMLASIRLTASGVVAVGASGWDRWQGGMSISRGADPLLAWLSLDLSRVFTRTLSLSDGSRHFGLHDVALLSGSIAGYGFADAPMTHSADADPNARSFGGLQVFVEPP